MEWLVKLFEPEKKTSTNTEQITCDKYRFNSCPKEFLDYLNPLFLNSIRGVDVGMLSISESLLSDFQDRARMNGIKQAVTHVVLSIIIVVTTAMALFSFMKYGAFMPDGTTNTPTSLLIAMGAYGFLVSLVYFHFYWYGKIAGMSHERVTENFGKKTVTPFMRWYIAFSVLLMIFSLLFINLPSGIANVLGAICQNVVSHGKVWGPFLNNTPLPDLKSFEEAVVYLKSGDLSALTKIGNGIFVAMIANNIFFAKIGYTRGEEEATEMTLIEKEVVRRKSEYKFDRAIRMLEESGF